MRFLTPKIPAPRKSVLGLVLWNPNCFHLASFMPFPVISKVTSGPNKDIAKFLSSSYIHKSIIRSESCPYLMRSVTGIISLHLSHSEVIKDLQLLFSQPSLIGILGEMLLTKVFRFNKRLWLLQISFRVTQRVRSVMSTFAINCFFTIIGRCFPISERLTIFIAMFICPREKWLS